MVIFHSYVSLPEGKHMRIEIMGIGCSHITVVELDDQSFCS